MTSQNLSLADEGFPVAVTRVFEGSVVPWEGAGYREDFEKAESTGGFFDLTQWGVVEIAGPDAADFLHRMSTWDVKRAGTGRFHHGAVLTGRAQPIALGFFEQVAGGFHFITPGPAAASAAEYLEKYHFAENLTIMDKSAEWALFGVWRSAALTAALGIPAETEPLREYAVENGRIRCVAWKDDSRPALVWVKMEREAAPRFFAAVREAGAPVPLLGTRLFERFRIAAAVPEIGIELSEKGIVLEANFDRAIARNKGCYPGQEVVERIFTYGQVNKKLWPVSLHLGSAGARFPEPPFPVSADAKEVGTVASLAEDPLDARSAVGLCYLRKQFWDREADFSADPDIAVRIRR